MRVVILAAILMAATSEFVSRSRTIKTFVAGPLYATVWFKNNTNRFFDINGEQRFRYAGLSIRRTNDYAIIKINNTHTAAYHVYGALKRVYAVTLGKHCQ